MNCPDVMMPPAIAARPRDHRGYPILFMLTDDDFDPARPRDDAGRPQGYSWQEVSPDRLHHCFVEGRCGICGGERGYWLAFVGGPLSIENRVFSDPPFHPECVEYARQVCPFLLNAWDRSHIRAASVLAEQDPDGTLAKPVRQGMLVTRKYSLFRGDGGAVLIRTAPAKRIEWFDEVAS